ncbi:MAG: OsmC-like protein [Myxococcaceae bacterium]|nr:OsmC-like protein [Myxococcaceae bacterium]
MTISSKTENPPVYAQRMQLGTHTVQADLAVADGGNDSGPSPHDLFDAALAACKTLTAHWYAKRSGMPLEGVEVKIERDTSKEREGVYKLQVAMSYHGALSQAELSKLHAAVSRCPVHKLMTTSEVVIETAPL